MRNVCFGAHNREETMIMSNTLRIGALAVCLAIPGIAHAGTATYTTTGGPEKPVGNEEYKGSYQDGTPVVTFSDGSKVNDNWPCIGVSQPPNAKLFEIPFPCSTS